MTLPLPCSASLPLTNLERELTFPGLPSSHCGTEGILCWLPCPLPSSCSSGNRRKEAQRPEHLYLLFCFSSLSPCPDPSFVRPRKVTAHLGRLRCCGCPHLEELSQGHRNDSWLSEGSWEQVLGQCSWQQGRSPQHPPSLVQGVRQGNSLCCLRAEHQPELCLHNLSWEGGPAAGASRSSGSQRVHPSGREEGPSS